MTIKLKEEGPNVLISPTRYSLEELDYLGHFKTSGEFDNLPEAEEEMRNRMSHNEKLEFRIVVIYPNETEVIMTSGDVVNADSLDDAEGDQAI